MSGLFLEKEENRNGNYVCCGSSVNSCYEKLKK
jgi:hypothetical protein